MKLVDKINGSQSFFFRARCKFCKSVPKYIYYLLNRMITTSSFYRIKSIYDNVDFELSTSDNFYLEHSIKNRNFKPTYMFESISSKKLPIPNMGHQQNNDRFTTVIECECGKTNWAFVRSNKDHIKNRKCKLEISSKELQSLYKILV